MTTDQKPEAQAVALADRLRTRPTGDPYLHMLVHEAADELARLTAALEAEKAEVFRLRDALAQAKGVPEEFVPRSAVEPLLTALRFYARGEHYHLDDDEDFDTVSGEPDNWLMSGRDGSSTMVEDGRVAQFALLGKPVNWTDGEDDETPQPIEGEVLAATPPSPAQAAGWRDIESAPLPEMPEPAVEDHDMELWGQNIRVDLYTGAQLLAYARAAIAAAPGHPPSEQPINQQV